MNSNDDGLELDVRKPATFVTQLNEAEVPRAAMEAVAACDPELHPKLLGAALCLIATLGGRVDGMERQLRMMMRLAVTDTRLTDLIQQAVQQPVAKPEGGNGYKPGGYA